MKYIYICLMAMTLTNVVAQVGVNTKLPLKPLHIDGKSDNPLTGVPSAEQMKNDVVVDEEGRLGIGTISPTEKIDVKGDILVEGIMKVNAIEASISNEVSPLFGSLKGDVGTSLVDLDTYLAYLEALSVNTVGTIDDFNKGIDVQMKFESDNIVMNVGNILGVTNNGDIKIVDNGYYHLSFSTTMYLTVTTSVSPLVYLKIQVLKSSDGGVTWGTPIVSVRPFFVGKTYGLFFPINVPNTIVELKKDDLLRVVFSRSKIGTNIEGDSKHEVKMIRPEGSIDLGFKAYQFSLLKL